MGLAQSSQDTNKNQTTNPWAPQAGYLTQGFGAASGALSQAQANANGSTPPGFVAQFTPGQLDAFQTMLKYGTGNPQIAANSANAGGALTNAGAGATTGGLYDLSQWRPSTSAASVLSDANTFANNPAISGMVDAATRDARRAVSEQALPQIARESAATGNINSSRRGIAEGILQRGLAEKAADISSNLRGSAFDRGLTTATDISQGNDASRLGALSSLISGGNQAVGTGVGANSGAVGQQGALFDIAGKGITGSQIGSQAALDDALQRYQFGVNSPFAGLNNFWNIVGSNNWGGTSTGNSTTTNNPSTMAQIGQAAGILGSLF